MKARWILIECLLSLVGGIMILLVFLVRLLKNSLLIDWSTNWKVGALDFYIVG